MTREEAIERFENVKANALAQKANGVSKYWQNEIDGTVEAIDMAIDALKTQNISKSESFADDLISRADVKAEATKFFGHWVVFENRIDNLPSVPSADRPSGEWIITKEGEYDGRSVYKTECSECGHETFYKANNAHYCPNCGAKMRNNK